MLRFLYFIPYFFIIVQFFFSCHQGTLPPKIILPTELNSLQENIDAIVINKMNQYHIPGLSIGIVRGDSIFYTKGYGLKRLSSEDTVSEHTIFHTASISKLFTAIAIKRLEDEGHLSINDKLVDLIPELASSDPDVKQITIKQLLNHTSGLPDISNYHWERQNQSPKSLENYILGLNIRLDNPPSSTYAYSNLGYDILGYVIERGSGVSFEDYLQENVLDISGMQHSDFRYFNIPISFNVSPHSKNRLTGSIYERKVYPYTREHAPSSTLNSSTVDLSHWMSYFMQKDQYSELLSPSTNLSSSIGLGFQIYQLDGHKAFGHFGGDKGFRSFLMMIPAKSMGVVLLANCDYHEDFRQEIVFDITRLILAEN